MWELLIFFLTFFSSSLLSLSFLKVFSVKGLQVMNESILHNLVQLCLCSGKHRAQNPTSFQISYFSPMFSQERIHISLSLLLQGFKAFTLGIWFYFSVGFIYPCFPCM